MQTPTEQQLIAVLQQISNHLSSINQKLASLQSGPSHLSNIAVKTGRK